MNKPTRRVAVIGGGITGLAAAHRLHELDPHLAVTLFEAASELGGILQTERREGCLIERAADMFITRDPWAMDLCRRIGFDRDLINTNEKQRKAYIVHRGKLVDVPEGFTLMSPAKIGPILKTPLLSWRGKLRLASEYFVRRRTEEADESLHDFSIRRFGREAYERLIQPLIGGIYTADPTKLSMAATMKQFVELERQHGSLIRGMRAAGAGAGKRPVGDAAASGARYGLFVAPRDGMSSLIAAIAQRLPTGAVRTNAPVQAVQPSADQQWMVTYGAEEERANTELFDAVVVATPGPRAAKLLRPWNARLGDEIGGIPMAGAAIVIGVYRKSDVAHPLDGFGFVVPLVEKRRILSSSFGSIKFPGRTPDDWVLTRTFFGGALQPEFLRWTDSQLCEAAHDELSQLIGARAKPLFGGVVRWDDKMPQYHVGHLDRVDRIERLVEQTPGLALAGNAYRGVGIPFCVRSGEAAALRIVEQMRARSV